MPRGYKHGGHGTHLYDVWRGMRARCLQPNAISYPYYGGRGITICAAWDDFAVFRSDMEPSYVEGLELDRRDNDGPYDPSNCCWSTPKEQCRNKRNNRVIATCRGEMILQDVALAAGVSQRAIHWRLEHGYTGEDLFKPATGRGKKQFPSYPPRKPVHVE